MPKAEILFSLSILPLIASILCVYLQIRLKKAQPLFLNLFFLAAFQAFGYWVMAVAPSYGHYLADAYLISIYFFLANLVVFAVYLTDGRVTSLLKCIYLGPVTLSVLHVSGLMVVDYRWEQSSLMHNDGTFAFLFDWFGLACLISTVSILLINSRRTRDRHIKSKNILMLYSFIPLVVMFGLLVTLSATRYAVSATIVSPITIIYVSLAYYYISAHDVVDCSSGTNFFLTRLKIAYQTLKIRNYNEAADVKKSIDDVLIAESMARNNNNISDAADEIAVHHTTLRYKLKKHKS